MKRALVCITIGLGLLLGGCARPSDTDYIGIDRAKAAALEAAGIPSEQAGFSTAGLDRQDGKEFYDVAFSSGGRQYRYRVDPVSGSILESRITDLPFPHPEESLPEESFPEESLPPQSEPEAGEGSRPASSAPAPSASSRTDAPIGEQAAQKAALEHAGLAENQVRILECELEWDGGRQVYEVEFYHAGSRTEYEYVIDAYTGEVWEYGSEHRASANGAGEAGGQPITAEEAAALALERVPGASRTDLTKLEADDDHGRLEYEGKIRYGGKVYEFEIDGATGAFLSWEEEIHH